ncbi:hypothetical protein DPMN_116567 [Dreissena polymorpha]|uniref:Uncharacterized protein n=1 Tax=Dreissena polymorpha TaxID=45954 RepID=A0A9D4QUV5_DREPO|nr:hypothetical protein DPMN_116567 [Dreissena polymorpha]
MRAFLLTASTEVSIYRAPRHEFARRVVPYDLSNQASLRRMMVACRDSFEQTTADVLFRTYSLVALFMLQMRSSLRKPMRSKDFWCVLRLHEASRSYSRMETARAL